MSGASNNADTVNIDVAEFVLSSLLIVKNDKKID